MASSHARYPHNSSNGQTIIEQKGKEEAFLETFREIMGKDSAREHTVDLDFLNIQLLDLSEQDLVFQEEEIWDVIKDMPSDRAPGPDGFIGAFFQKAWNVIKRDILSTLHKLFLDNGRGFGRLNQALISLIPKTAVLRLELVLVFLEEERVMQQ